MFHQYSIVKEINFPIYFSPSDENAICSVVHTWHNLNSLWCIYAVFPARSDNYGVRVTFNVKYDNPSKSISFRDYSQANAEHLSANNGNEVHYCSPPNSIPKEDAEYIVILLRTLFNKKKTLQQKTLTRRRLLSQGPPQASWTVSAKNTDGSVSWEIV